MKGTVSDAGSTKEHVYVCMCPCLSLVFGLIPLAKKN